MAIIIKRVGAFLRGPRGQRLARQARDGLRERDYQRRLRELTQRLRQRA